MITLPSKKHFRPDEVAQIFCLSNRTVYRMMKDGRLPGVRGNSGPWRISRDSLLFLIPPTHEQVSGWQPVNSPGVPRYPWGDSQDLPDVINI